MKDLKREYAKLVVTKGVAIDEGQGLYIRADVKAAEFAYLLVEEAYKLGAKDVLVKWNSEEVNHLAYQYKTIEELTNVNMHTIKEAEELAEQNYGFLTVKSTNPDLLNDVDPEKVAAAAKAQGKASQKYSRFVMSDRANWCVISVPTEEWAKKVFPDAEKPVEKMWDAILKMTRADVGDPLKNWDEHLKELDDLGSKLNSYKLKSLHYTNSLGTDLKIGFNEDHLWLSGGGANVRTGKLFVANIPTEEVFTLPDRNNVNGIVYASKPLNYGGTLIDDFYIEFKEGKAVNWEAKQGNEALTKLINSDEGSAYLGEAALVSHNTPISLSNILFYSTLFDENASCHLALGRAYPTCLVDGANLSDEELKAKGANSSIVHVDFMFGTEDLNIIGETQTGETVQIFKDGNFAI